MVYRLFVFYVAILVVLLSAVNASSDSLTQTLEKRGVKKWTFWNWNKYKKAIVGEQSKWSTPWGIHKHRGWLWAWSGSENKNAAVRDPSKKTKDLVLRVKYTAKSRNPEVNPIGGVGFLAEPLSITAKSKKVTLQYSVFFPKGFDFVKGGKLPGLYGGHGECTGGDESGSCFTTRLMWRTDGEGEIYAYLPNSKQRKNLCDNKINICNPDYGFSLGRGTFQFKTGTWTTVRQELVLNSQGKRNGQMSLYVNGVRKINVKNVAFRTSNTGHVVGIMFHTFFGGSDDTWRTPKDQYSYFKNFVLKVS
ncbi:hypothetical protein RMATCC62417_01699 [Rhizopus microsporus]|nr:hypothetical protein RMATCC62417_01699 [Rhizopus microsporus]